MKVSQPDSRSIRIVSETGVRIAVPYFFFWNGHERPAESIAREESRGLHEVRAFFLFGEIRDRIREDRAGITISRTWSVKTPGSVHLDIDLELDPTAGLAWLFPGVHRAAGLPPVSRSFLGERTAYPASLFVTLGTRAFLVYSPSARCGPDHGSIGIARAEVEDEPPRLRVRLRFPGVEEPPPQTGSRPRDVEPPDEPCIESPGSLERAHDICLAFASREEIPLRGPASVLQRIEARPAEAPALRSAEKAAEALAERSALEGALKTVLARHLVQDGGVAGLREIPDAPWLSASAGVGCAWGILRLFPGDARLVETALRLADFALKGQVPWGSFYESYHLPSGRWRGVRGMTDVTLLSIGQSASIAELLLSLSAELARMGRPHEKYFQAGLRCVDFFLDGKGKLMPPGELQSPAAGAVQQDAASGLAGMELFFPLALVGEKTGRDRYRKALDALVRRFSAIPWDSFDPPSSREGRSGESAGALLAARLFVRMRGLGYRPAEPPATGAAAKARSRESARLFASLLVPWVRVQDAGSCRGCLHDSFARQRLLCAGRQTALLLRQLAALTAEDDARLLRSLAMDCAASARRLPVGTAYVRHTSWEAPTEHSPKKQEPAVGPVDSRRVASEVLAGLRLLDEPGAP